MAFHRPQMQECSGGNTSEEVNTGVNLNWPVFCRLALVPVFGRSCRHPECVVFLHWPPPRSSLVVYRRKGVLDEKKTCVILVG